MLSSIEWVRRWAPVLLTTSLSTALLMLAARWTLRRPEFARSRARSAGVWTLLSSCLLWLAVGASMNSYAVAHSLSSAWSQSITAGALLIAILSVSAFLYAWFNRHPRFDPERRGLLLLGRNALVAAPALAAGYGMVLERFQIRTREVDIKVPGLPKDLQGLRIAQLSDIHRGVFGSRSEVDRAVAMANECRPHLTVVTGDLITRRGDPLDDCLDALRALKADSGVWGCLGNHETYAHVEDYTSIQGARIGIRFLRQEATWLRFGASGLNLAGVDYQRMHLPYLRGMERVVRPGEFNLLLSHSPDVFPIAAEKGFQVTLAGHTHGGQINVEILNENVNLARFFTPYVLGLYEKDGASIYVTPGLGTVGVPIRLGAPPEVTIVRLCAV